MAALAQSAAEGDDFVSEVRQTQIVEKVVVKFPCAAGARTCAELHRETDLRSARSPASGGNYEATKVISQAMVAFHQSSGQSTSVRVKADVSVSFF